MTTPEDKLATNSDEKTPESAASKNCHFLAWSVFNRDLMQLEFFRRVLEEATDEALPLLERLKFLAIFASHLDEFFMVRVSGLKEMLDLRNLGPMPGELTPTEQLSVIRERVLPMAEMQATCLRERVLPGLAKEGVVIAPYGSLSEAEKQTLSKYFMKSVFPVLTPLAVDPAHPFPHITNKSLNIGVRVEPKPDHELDTEFCGEGNSRFVRIKVPPVVPRLVSVGDGGHKFTLLEELIEAHLHSLFPRMRLSESHLFRVTRDADVEIRDDKAADLLELIKESLRERRFGLPVRLEVESTMPREMVQYLTESLGIEDDDVYVIDGTLGVADLMELYGLERPDLRDQPIRTTVPAPLAKKKSLFESIKKQDVLLHHPYT
ncbi:MAG: RNA degradosome polyphosphate kinase, partial [Pyrinomonadaceae bacterium]